MSYLYKNNGICSTCINSKDCTYQENHKETIWQCEEYNGNIIEQTKNVYSEKTEQTEAETDVFAPRDMPGKSEEIYKGLCINCENRFVCDNKRVEGGIWHCENYE
ncbi:MAG: hypothetical protein JXJ04_08035 [Spirochaetales bacterium]|nr:hypothetical protein [Spirochaetales bacterium]